MIDPAPEVITLDVGGTLIDPKPSVGAVYAEVLSLHGIHADIAELQGRFKAAFQRKTALRRTDVCEEAERDFWREVVHDVMGHHVPRGLSFDALFHEVWETFAHARRWQPKPGAAECLATLHERGWPIYIFSNWDSRLRRVLAEFGWDRHVRDVFISSELGAEKPHPEAFRKVEAKIGRKGLALLHVGDSLIHDYQGAQAAGWQALLMDGTFSPNAGPEPRRLATLHELPALLPLHPPGPAS